MCSIVGLGSDKTPEGRSGRGAELGGEERGGVPSDLHGRRPTNAGDTPIMLTKPWIKESYRRSLVGVPAASSAAA
jgi:hypothetical protein